LFPSLSATGTEEGKGESNPASSATQLSCETKKRGKIDLASSVHQCLKMSRILKDLPPPHSCFGPTSKKRKKKDPLEPVGGEKKGNVLTAV